MNGKVIGSILIVLVAVATAILLSYSQKFTQDSNITATAGIVFKKTLNLEHYKPVSSGLGVWGRYTNYSRSDRQTEYITVYCNKYCSK